MQISFISVTICGISSVSLALALTVVLVAVVHHYLKSQGLPPGPVGVPYFGYWAFLKDSHCAERLHDCTKKYGDVFSFTSFGRLYISLGSIKSVREAYVINADCFGEKPTDFGLLSHVFADGVGAANGEAWKVLRKFFLRVLKERGAMSIKDSMAGPVYESIKSTTEVLKGLNGEPANIIGLVTEKCTTILRMSLFGYTGISNELIKKLNDYYNVVLASMTPKNMLMSGNIARYLAFPLMPCYHEAMANLKKMETLLYEVIGEHESTYDKEHCRDVIDEYFKERNDRKIKRDPMAHHFTDKALMATLLQFVGDGVLFVALMICLFIQILLDHPEEQDKIYEELVEVVGLDRQPTTEDKSKLTYTNAFLMEAVRMANFFPFFPSLECTKETTLGGYRIPKGSITLINKWSAHLDPEVFDKPETFDPLRFIPEEGNPRPELPITFGIGKRSCIGEGFTMMQMFLFLVTIIQNFHLTLPEGCKTRSFDDLITGKLRMVAVPRERK